MTVIKQTTVFHLYAVVFSFIRTRESSRMFEVSLNLKLQTI